MLQGREGLRVVDDQIVVDQLHPDQVKVEIVRLGGARHGHLDEVAEKALVLTLQQDFCKFLEL